ncbi:MAG: hypothetical protein PVF27_07795 [Gemmatimonadales bacterium]
MSVPRPVYGVGWGRLAGAVAEAVPVDAIDGIWLFRPVRNDDREWGTAVITCRTETERLRVYTASYLVVVRGRERRQGKLTVEEVGASPSAVLDDVLQGVRERAGETESPVPIAPSDWYPEPPATPGDEVQDSGGSARDDSGPATRTTE